MPVLRVSDRSSFARLRTTDMRARSGPVSVSFCPCGAPPVTQVAYAVGRTVGTAVVRNRLRRRLRAVVAEVSPGMAPGVYLVSARREAACLRRGELTTAVGDAMRAASRKDGDR